MENHTAGARAKAGYIISLPVNLQSGARLGPYEIVEAIGAGGMGEVYRARDTRLGRTVAIKTLPADFAQDAKLKLRFDREAKAISSLNHPHICTLYDVGDSYLVMEYCEGTTLSHRITEGPVPVEEALRHGIEIAEALEQAHRQGIVHRDLKPGNVMITDAGVKLLDFGLARREALVADSTTEEMLSEAGTIVGTVQYMAPEVLRGKPADVRSDVFALGLILYEMLAGKRAFGGSSKAAVIAAILEQAPPSLTNVNPALDVLVRECLEKNPDERIQTANDVRRQLRAISDGAPTPRVRSHAAQPLRRWRIATIALVPLMALTGTVFWMWWQRAAASASQIRSLAVLPFENLSKPDDEYIAAGMHDGVIGELSQVSALRVISRTSALHYAQTKKTVPEIARELNVDAIVEGSMTRSGNDVHMQVSLVRTQPEERQVWSKAYQRAIGETMTLQSDVARAIALATSIALTPEESARLSRARTSRENEENYLRGMFFVRKLTAEGAQKGLAYLNQAVASDPSDPSAHAGLALAYSIMSHGPSPPPEVYGRAKAEAQKAIELDDTVAEAHAALGAIAMYHDWDWVTTERELRRALQLNPNFAQAHRDYGWYLDLPGPNPASIEEIKRAKELDPLTPLYASDLGWLYYRAGRLDDAVRETRSAAELDPSVPQGKFALVVACSERGLHDEAIAAAKRAVAASPVWKFALAYAYAKAGRRDEARTLAAEAARKPAPVSTWGLAYVYAALGDKEEALRWLQKGVDARFGFLLWMKGTPAFAPLRGDPRFEALVRRLNLPS